MKRKRFQGFHLLALLLLLSCQKDSPIDPANIPTISTTIINNITGSTAQGGGEVTSDGGAIVTARGIVWGLESSPTILSNTISDGSGGLGAFSSTLNGLDFGTTYFVRAFATNTVGTAYGNEISFKTLDDPSGIYVCGIDGPGVNVAAYWKNGVVTDLVTDRSASSGANAIAISGSDVYVVGYINLAIKYWKNNTIFTITDGQYEASARTIAVSGTDVYIGGYESNANGNPVAKIWKNGTPTILSDGTSDAAVNQIVVANGDVYAAGYVRYIDPITLGFKYKAKYWKNGNGFDLTDGATIATANSIFVNGTDVYVVGYRRNNIGYDIAMFWKNGIGTELTDGASSSSATSVFVSNGDVHIIGREGSYATDIWAVKYWKNFNPTTLEESRFASSKSIIVNGNDIYILYTNDGTNSILLKNGNIIAPYDGSSKKIIARGIFVK